MKTKRKNIFKSLLALTLALIMVLGVAPISELAGVDFASLFAPKAEAATYGIYTYEVDEDATITITGCNKSANGAITIPSKIDGKPVTRIGDGAFEDCTGLTSITLGNSVTSIGEMAFLCCTGLTSITILDSVTSIGACAFADCTGLTSITIPNSVTSIEDAAFDGCASLKDVYYTGSKDEWKAISIGEYNGCLLNATIHYNWTGEHVCTNKKLVTVPAQCEVNGMSYYICTECGKQIGEATIIPATGHSWGEWHVTKDATATTEGSRERECAACGKKETEIIPILAQIRAVRLI